jgi:hypothetical protein
VEDDDEWPHPPLMVEQMADKGPHARLQLLWHNFTIAMRHVVRLQALDAQADVGVSPMHVAQKDETLASIARVRTAYLTRSKRQQPDQTSTCDSARKPHAMTQLLARAMMQIVNAHCWC